MLMFHLQSCIFIFFFFIVFYFTVNLLYMILGLYFHFNSISNFVFSSSLTQQARGRFGAEGLSGLDGSVSLYEHRPPADGQVPARQQRRCYSQVSVFVAIKNTHTQQLLASDLLNLLILPRLQGASVWVHSSDGGCSFWT